MLPHITEVTDDGSSVLPALLPAKGGDHKRRAGTRVSSAPRLRRFLGSASWTI